MLKLTDAEFFLMSKYIREQCAIDLDKGKEYLVENRLSDLVIETGCKSFSEFYIAVQREKSGKLRDRIIDAMTTNETSWYRDKYFWDYMEEVCIPGLLDRAAKYGGAKVWSAAASTGQEAYSLLMSLDEAAKLRAMPSLVNKIDIQGTDISSSALFIAISARYDNLTINRGLPQSKRTRYFTQEGKIWVFNQELKKRVQFKKFNLLNSFSMLGKFDLVLCRNVAIYFSDAFKRELYKKIAGVLNPGGILLIGATESLKDYSTDFEISRYKNAVIHTRK